MSTFRKVEYLSSPTDFKIDQQAANYRKVPGAFELNDSIISHRFLSRLSRRVMADLCEKQTVEALALEERIILSNSSFPSQYPPGNQNVKSKGVTNL
ncbi:hypothetical protein WA026_003979 [Henosepilachna vigintioctopunctata]|uniref:Uncharacterized protein n=1 Tax=Henosepilachna vigintioctopunctata TaxID=420089 RepID=A0AAW1UIA8_9CUCU